MIAIALPTGDETGHLGVFSQFGRGEIEYLCWRRASLLFMIDDRIYYQDIPPLWIIEPDGQKRLLHRLTSGNCKRPFLSHG